MRFPFFFQHYNPPTDLHSGEIVVWQKIFTIHFFITVMESICLMAIFINNIRIEAITTLKQPPSSHLFVSIATNTRNIFCVACYAVFARFFDLQKMFSLLNEFLLV